MKQRNLKFRAWDKLQNKFLYPYPNGFDILGETTCFDLIGMQIKEFTPNLTTLERLNDVIITQFTGIYDKNKKEIFEGDILKVELFTKPYLITYGNSEKFGASFCVESKHSTWYLCKIWADSSEIIGNIFENPELYEVEKL